MYLHTTIPPLRTSAGWLQTVVDDGYAQLRGNACARDGESAEVVVDVSYDPVTLEADVRDAYLVRDGFTIGEPPGLRREMAAYLATDAGRTLLRAFMEVELAHLTAMTEGRYPSAADVERRDRLSRALEAHRADENDDDWYDDEDEDRYDEDDRYDEEDEDRYDDGDRTF